MRTMMRWIPANKRIVNTACAIGGFNMKKPKLFVWQNPMYFKYGGLYLQVMGKRYRVFKFGKY